MLTLVVLAAGLSTRYGRLKQLEPVGPSGEALLDYGMFDAWRAGFERVVLVVRPEIDGLVRAHCAARWAGRPIDFVYQELSQVPPGASVPEGRTKPWGTAHAALAAEHAVRGPFAVANADDFYGAAAYTALAAHLRGGGECHALVGYRLADTLSPHGGVSRGICETRADKTLRGLAEVHDIRAGTGGLTGRTVDGRTVRLTPDDVTSMNVWGFRPAIFPLLHEAFARFLAQSAGDLRAEFLLSAVAGELAAEEQARFQVLAGGDTWMGVTFPDDREAVAARLRALAATQRYPAALSADLAQAEQP
jgi:MobA-like NTP transferase domain